MTIALQSMEYAMSKESERKRSQQRGPWRLEDARRTSSGGESTYLSRWIAKGGRTGLFLLTPKSKGREKGKRRFRLGEGKLEKRSEITLPISLSS